MIARVVSGILTGMDFSGIFMTSFFNTIVNKAVGNTGITCLIALLNQTMILSRMVGLSILNYVNYDIFVITCLVAQAVLLTLLFPYANIIDKKDTNL